MYRDSNGSVKFSKFELIIENILLELDKIDGISFILREGLLKVFKSEVFMLFNKKKECFDIENF